MVSAYGGSSSAGTSAGSSTSGNGSTQTPLSNIGVCVLSNGSGTNLYICDALYDYALSLNSDNGIVPACLSVGLTNLNPSQKNLIQILDLLGRETRFKPNTPLIYVYDDGSIEKVFSVAY